MRSHHNLFRALSIGFGLALLVVTGTAAMIGALSRPLTDSGAPYSVYLPVSAAPQFEATQQAAAADSLLYERVASSQGYRWVLTGEAQATEFLQATRDTIAANRTMEESASLSTISYALQAKPAGWNKQLKTCASADAGKSVPRNGAYDISCVTLG